jgi:hypothetical protein
MNSTLNQAISTNNNHLGNKSSILPNSHVDLIFLVFKIGTLIENRARLRWLASAVAVLPVVGSIAGSAPTSHRPLFIWRVRDLFPIVQATSAPCVHCLGLVYIIGSSLCAVCVRACVMCIVREFGSPCTQIWLSQQSVLSSAG